MNIVLHLLSPIDRKLRRTANIGEGAGASRATRWRHCQRPAADDGDVQ